MTNFWSTPLLARTASWPRQLFFDQTVFVFKPLRTILDPKKPWPMRLLFGAICCSCVVLLAMDSLRGTSFAQDHPVRVIPLCCVVVWCVGAVCVCVQDFRGCVQDFGPHPHFWGPTHFSGAHELVKKRNKHLSGHRRVGGPKRSRFFFLLPPQFFFISSSWGSFRGIWVVFEATGPCNARLEFLGCRVKPRRFL